MPARHGRRHIAHRLVEVVGICLTHGFGALYRRALGKPVDGPRLVRELFERLGGAFIKFGQILSLQVEMLPRPYCDALLALLDRIPPFGRAAVARTFREELGSLPEELFQNFEYSPIASASIGQVHKAVLPDGTKVAVKVQRPQIDILFERDSLLLAWFVGLIVMFRLRGLYFLRESVKELTAWTQDELDYRREASYCQYLGRKADGVAIEEIPKIYWEFTTRRILVAEFLEGPSVAQYFRMTEASAAAANAEAVARLREEGFEPAEFTANIITNFLRDAFLSGAFHADLHPANLLIRPGNVVGYVDFGIVAFMTPETRRKMVQLIRTYASGDIGGMFECLLDVCTLEEDADLAAARRAIEEIAPGWYAQPAVYGRVRFRISATKAFMDVFAVYRRCGILLDREMVRFIRSLFFVDGLVSRLASTVDLADKLRNAVEMWEVSEARRKVSSAGAALVLMTDAVLWTRAGPAGVLRSLSALERKLGGQGSVVNRTGRGAGREARLRVRALAAGAVWLVLTLVLASGSLVPEPEHTPFQAILAGVVVLTWTAWSARCVWRVTAR